MNQDENVKKNLEFLEELKRKGVNFDLRICPKCKSASIQIMDVVGMYSPLSPTRAVCKKCGWVGRAVIEMTNRRIDELDEEMLEDIINIVSEDEKEK